MIGDSTALTLASVIAAVTSVGVAAWQGWLQKQSLKHSLYEKRLKVFHAVMSYLSGVLVEGDRPLDTTNRLVQETREAQFLFRPEISAFVEEIISKGVQFGSLNELIRRLPDGPRKDGKRDEWETMTKWFLTEATPNAKRLFGPYLRLSDGDDARPFVSAD
jgi:hypothetical protein